MIFDFALGLATLLHKPSNIIEHMNELLNFAIERIPTNKHRETVLYLLATAGMRLLSVKDQNFILDSIRRYVPKHFPFHFPPSHASVISGKLEGKCFFSVTIYSIGL